MRRRIRKAAAWGSDSCSEAELERLDLADAVAGSGDEALPHPVLGDEYLPAREGARLESGVARRERRPGAVLAGRALRVEEPLLDVEEVVGDLLERVADVLDAVGEAREGARDLHLAGDLEAEPRYHFVPTSSSGFAMSPRSSSSSGFRVR